ncbi:MAG: hypothetical protein NPIRA02_41440 [Nitrospirales bacterium]|nr:MAG: hypothetical protein NPIRA02_41440 [Nitrospirales bacterium]
MIVDEMTGEIKGLEAKWKLLNSGEVTKGMLSGERGGATRMSEWKSGVSGMFAGSE